MKQNFFFLREGGNPIPLSKLRANLNRERTTTSHIQPSNWPSNGRLPLVGVVAMAAWNVGHCVVRLPEKAGDAYTRNGHVSAVDVAEQSRSSRKGATGTITIKWLRDEVKKIDIDEVEVFDVADIAKKVKQVAAVVAPPAASRKSTLQMATDDPGCNHLRPAGSLSYTL